MEDDEIVNVCSSGNEDDRISKYTVMQEIGAGAYGRVSIVYKDGDRTLPLVVKVQEGKQDRFDVFINEAKLSKLFYEKYRVGPKFYDAWYCSKPGSKNSRKYIGYIVTEKKESDLQRYFRTGREIKESDILPDVVIEEQAVAKFKADLNRIHQAGYMHRDLMPKNVLVSTKKVGNKTHITEIVMTDFGLTMKTKDIGGYMIMEMLKYLNKGYGEDKLTFEDIQKDINLLDSQLLTLLERIVRNQKGSSAGPARNPSPVRQKSPSPVRQKSPSPVRQKSPSPKLGWGRKTCPTGKILNPATGKCVSRTGAIGKKILAAKPKSPSPARPKTKVGKILNPETGRYVSRNGAIGRKILAAAKSPVRQKIMSPIKKILNPATGRYVSRNGAIGRKLVAAAKKQKSPSPVRPKQKECPQGKILNPKTNRCVKRNGTIGKKL